MLFYYCAFNMETWLIIVIILSIIVVIAAVGAVVYIQSNKDEARRSQRW